MDVVTSSTKANAFSIVESSDVITICALRKGESVVKEGKTVPLVNFMKITVKSNVTVYSTLGRNSVIVVVSL